MLLFPTILVGSLFGYSFGGNFFGALIAGILSYYLINLIPHWTPENFKRKEVVIVRYTDFVLSFIYFSFLLFVIGNNGNYYFQLYSSQSISVWNYMHFLGAIGSLTLFLLFYFLKGKEIKNEYLKIFYEISQKLSYTDRSLWGIFVQVAIVIVCLTVLFRIIDFPSWQMIVSSLIR